MSLPPEIDFEQDPSATPARMNLAMVYLLALARQGIALQPDFESAIRDLQAVGLSRLNEVLSPILVDAQDIVDDLEAMRTAVANGTEYATLLSSVATALAAAGAASAAAAAASNTATANDATAVHKTGNEDIAGTKNFTGILQLAGVALKNAATRAKATVAELRARQADVVVTADLVKDALAYVNVAYAAAMTVDCQAGVNFEATLTGSISTLDLQNPIVGTTLSLYLIGSDATARAVTAFSSKFKGDLPALADITSTKAYELTIKIRGATHFIVTAVRAL